MTRERNNAVSKHLRLVVVALVAALMILAGCGTASPAVSSATATLVPTQQPPATLAPTTPPLPTMTASQSATATLQPSATHTASATPVPPLALLEDDGFSIWCAPLEYTGFVPDHFAVPVYGRRMAQVGEKLQVTIPAGYCTFVAQFNQAAPRDAQVYLYDALNYPFQKLALQPDPEQPGVAWAFSTHPFLTNPPFWEVSYRVTLLSADGKELWSNPVNFAKPLPKPCPYGGLPDPVTFYCNFTDPGEHEPHPDVTYPYDRTRLPTDEN